MADTRADNIVFLEEAKSTLILLEEAKEAVRNQDLKVKRLEKGLAAEKKAVNDSIELTIRKRKAEITDSYDAQIEDVQGQLRKEKARREKAKNLAIEQRIAQETAEVSEENRQLRTELTTLFRKNRVPGFCNSLLFYALYYTRGFREFFVAMISLVLVIFGIPMGVFALSGSSQPLVLMVIYILDILIFGGIYVAITNLIKVPHHDTLSEGRRIRNRIMANRKQMRATQNRIRKDKNEERYGLEDYDAEIYRLESEKAEVATKKQEALTTFENNGKVLLSKEIMENNQERIHQLEEDVMMAADVLSELQAQGKTLSRQITENYEPLLGREFLNTEKIDRMLVMFREGQVANITEAQELVRAGKKMLSLVDGEE